MCSLITTTALLEQTENGTALAALLQLVCDSSVDATVIMDSTGIVVTLNREALDLFGYSRWQVVGRNVSMLMEPRIAKVHDMFLARYLRTKIRRIIGTR
jgi:two-component system sensor kinase FixL